MEKRTVGLLVVTVAVAFVMASTLLVRPAFADTCVGHFSIDTYSGASTCDEAYSACASYVYGYAESFCAASSATVCNDNFTADDCFFNGNNPQVNCHLTWGCAPE